MNEENKNEFKEEISKPKRNKLTLTFIVVGLLMISAAVVLLLLPNSNKKNSDSSNQNDNNKVDEKIVTEQNNLLDYRMLGNSIEKFDLYFLKLENEEKNKVYSPLSIKYTLEMLSEGTNGESKAQLDTVIGSYNSKKYTNDNNKSFANAMFIRDSFNDSIKDEYKSILKDKYDAEVIVDSFSSPDNINKWISSKTYDLIPDLIKDVNGKDFFLVNALAIDMKWNNQIHCAYGSKKNVPCYGNDGAYYVEYLHEKVEGEDHEYTEVSFPYDQENEFYHLTFNGKENTKAATILASFNRYDAVNTIGEENIRNEIKNAYEEWLNSEDGKIAKEYGTAEDTNELIDRFVKELNDNYGKNDISTDFLLYVDDNVKAFAKDLQTYDNTTLQYIGIMPNNDILSNYINNVSVDDLNTIINNLKELKIENFDDGYVTLIEGEIPFFKYEYELNLMEDLKNLGIVDVFDNDKADLSGMLKEGGASIIEAKHKANIEFSNEGIRAAAATEEGGLGNIKDGFNYLFEVPTKRIDLTFDKPYMYLIRDKESGEVWFIGTVYEPITK